MGVLTRALRNLVVSTLVHGSPSLHDDDTATHDNDGKRWQPQRKVDYLLVSTSVFMDLLDSFNLILDFIFTIRLFSFDGAAVYAVTILVGIVVGQLTSYRGTTLLLRGHGLPWNNPFGIAPTNPVSTAKHWHEHAKQEQAFSLMLCLMVTETTLFLWEDYPTLVTYAHWEVVSGPEELNSLDFFNIGMTLTTLAAVLGVAAVGMAIALWRLDWRAPDQTWLQRLTQLVKVTVVLSACGFLGRLVLQIAQGAIRFAFQDVRVMPSTSVVKLEICPTMAPSTDPEHGSCDERVFAVRVAIAWSIALFLLVCLFRTSARTVVVETTTAPTSTGLRETLPNSSGTRTTTSTGGEQDSRGGHALWWTRGWERRHYRGNIDPSSSLIMVRDQHRSSSRHHKRRSTRHDDHEDEEEEKTPEKADFSMSTKNTTDMDDDDDDDDAEIMDHVKEIVPSSSQQQRSRATTRVTPVRDASNNSTLTDAAHVSVYSTDLEAGRRSTTTVHSSITTIATMSIRDSTTTTTNGNLPFTHSFTADSEAAVGGDSVRSSMTSVESARSSIRSSNNSLHASASFHGGQR